MLSVAAKSPQLSIDFTTSDENTPESMIQLNEVVSMNISVTLPEVRLLHL